MSAQTLLNLFFKVSQVSWPNLTLVPQPIPFRQLLNMRQQYANNISAIVSMSANILTIIYSTAKLSTI
jgi:hypothetical protein